MITTTTTDSATRRTALCTADPARRRHETRLSEAARRIPATYPQQDPGCADIAPASPGKNLDCQAPDVLHSCYEYNYISPSIGWGYTRLHMSSLFGGK